VAVLSLGVVSPPPLTVATFVTETASAATLTEMRIGSNEAPAASADAREQVTV
jgi:hypothetical protein